MLERKWKCVCEASDRQRPPTVYGEGGGEGKKSNKEGTRLHSHNAKKRKRGLKRKTSRERTEAK